jgi:ketosteroid isomerase-like protein
MSSPSGCLSCSSRPLGRLSGVPAPTPGDAQDILATYKRGWEKRDPDVIMSLFGPDAVYREDPFAEELTGANAIRERWNHICANTANVEFDAERVWVAGATVLASWHAAYTRQSDGGRVRVRGFVTLELDDGRLIGRFRQWPVEKLVGTDSTFKIEE